MGTGDQKKSDRSVELTTGLDSVPASRMHGASLPNSAKTVMMLGHRNTAAFYCPVICASEGPLKCQRASLFRQSVATGIYTLQSVRH